MIIVAGNNPAMAHRVVMVARQLSPATRIAFRTHYMAEVQQLSEVGADIVFTEELESIVQLFGKLPKTLSKIYFFYQTGKFIFIRC